MTKSSSRNRLRGWKVLCCGLAALSVTIVAGPAGAARKPANPPGAPTITSVTAVKHGILIAFTAPADNGGAKINHYRARCVSSDGGKAGGGSSQRLHIRARGVVGGKTYTCTVVARNRAGTGPASAPSNPVVVLAH